MHKSRITLKVRFTRQYKPKTLCKFLLVYDCAFNLPSRKEFNARHETFATSCHINYKKTGSEIPGCNLFFDSEEFSLLPRLAKLKCSFNYELSTINWIEQQKARAGREGALARGDPWVRCGLRFSDSPVLWALVKDICHVISGGAGNDIWKRIREVEKEEDPCQKRMSLSMRRAVPQRKNI